MSAAITPIRPLTLAERQAVMRAAFDEACHETEAIGGYGFSIKRVWELCEPAELVLRESLSDVEAAALMRHACDDLPPLDDGAAGRIELVSLVCGHGRLDVAQAVSRARTFHPADDLDDAIDVASDWLRRVGRVQSKRAAALEHYRSSRAAR